MHDRIYKSISLLHRHTYILHTALCRRLTYGLGLPIHLQFRALAQLSSLSRSFAVHSLWIRSGPAGCAGLGSRGMKCSARTDLCTSICAVSLIVVSFRAEHRNTLGCESPPRAWIGEPMNLYLRACDAVIIVVVAVIVVVVAIQRYCFDCYGALGTRRSGRCCCCFSAFRP